MLPRRPGNRAWPHRPLRLLSSRIGLAAPPASYVYPSGVLAHAVHPLDLAAAPREGITLASQCSIPCSKYTPHLGTTHLVRALRLRQAPLGATVAMSGCAASC